MAFAISFCISCSISRPGYTWKRGGMLHEAHVFCLMEDYGAFRIGFPLWRSWAYNTLLAGWAYRAVREPLFYTFQSCTKAGWGFSLCFFVPLSFLIYDILNHNNEGPLKNHSIDTWRPQSLSLETRIHRIWNISYTMAPLTWPWCLQF